MYNIYQKKDGKEYKLLVNKLVEKINKTKM